MKPLHLVLCIALSLFACTPEAEPVTQPEAPPAPAEEPQAEAPPPVEEVPAEPTADDMPLPEDFEEEVATTITDQNYESELDKLEKELKEGK